jgi:hypothetical protein
MKQYKGTITSATTQQVINSSDLPTSTGSNECTYSIWIFIDNWNDFYGEKKVILTRGYTGSSGSTGGSTAGSSLTVPSFELYLDEYGNNLVAKSLMLRNQPGGYKYYDEGKYIDVQNAWNNTLVSGNTPSENLYYLGFTNNPTGLTGNQIKKACNIDCDATSGCVGYSYDGAWDTNCVLLGTLNNLPPDISLVDFSDGSTGFSALKTDQFYHTCEVSKIPTQKWVNVVVSISTISVDIYINGKLSKTCLTNGTLMSSDFDVILSPNGVGFTGSNARFQYWSNYMAAKDVWKIYARGYQKTFDIGQYSLSLGVYKGDVEKTSITI